MNNKYYVVFDTETTGLLEPMGTALYLQPHVIEIYAAALDKNFNLVQEFESFVKPSISIPKHITKINGITDEMVANAPTFAEILKPLSDVFSGCSEVVAANLSFDLGILRTELKRNKRTMVCPSLYFCTIEQSMHLKGYRLSNDKLYKIATGKELIGAHRAKADVMATIENLKFLKGGRHDD
jgi:DNA polymerase III epsilon subunit family exonuclease